VTQRFPGTDATPVEAFQPGADPTTSELTTNNARVRIQKPAATYNLGNLFAALSSEFTTTTPESNAETYYLGNLFAALSSRFSVFILGRNQCCQMVNVFSNQKCHFG
jgi:hypothetical protein